MRSARTDKRDRVHGVGKDGQERPSSCGQQGRTKETEFMGSARTDKRDRVHGVSKDEQKRPSSQGQQGRTKETKFME